MSAKKPLVLDSTGSTQQVQIGDRLDADASGVVAVKDFEQLRFRHNLLVQILAAHGIELPRELLNEL